MKAAVCHEFGAPLVVQEVNIRAPQTGEVAVKLAACAICHSDFLYADGAWGGGAGPTAGGLVQQEAEDVEQEEDGHDVQVREEALRRRERDGNICKWVKCSGRPLDAVAPLSLFLFEGPFLLHKCAHTPSITCSCRVDKVVKSGNTPRPFPCIHHSSPLLLLFPPSFPDG